MLEGGVLGSINSSDLLIVRLVFTSALEVIFNLKQLYRYKRTTIVEFQLCSYPFQFKALVNLHFKSLFLNPHYSLLDSTS